MNTVYQDPGEKMISRIKLSGILLIALGILGIFVPQLLSLFVEGFLAAMMLIGAAVSAYHTYHFNRSSITDWLKPLILLIGGVLLLVYPSSGVAAIILMVSFYFFTDAFASFALSYERYPTPGWFWMTLNGVLSTLLAFLVLIGWPESSLMYLGIFIAISLIFDGWVLFMLSRTLKID
jgi:uncharacterized membrane protein HdeD (DUF308 family)